MAEQPAAAEGSLMPGFGSQPGDFGDAGIEIPPPPDNEFEQLVGDIHRIKQKYVDGATNFRREIRLAANATYSPTQELDFTSQVVNSVILTVATGVIFFYTFDVSNNNGNPALLPDLAVSAGVVPNTVQIMLPERDDYKFGIQEGAGSTATGVIRVLKL